MKRHLTALAGFVTLLGPDVAVAAAAPQAEQCLRCHRGIEDAHPRKPLACTACHRGDGTATTRERAHGGLWRNPSDLRFADQACGRCHAAITRAVKASIMAHRSGTPSGTFFANGLQPARETAPFAMTPVPVEPAVRPRPGEPLPSGALPRLAPMPAFAASGNVFVDLLRKECAACHLWTPPRALRGNFRATGCAACHMPYAEDGRSRSADRTRRRDRMGPLRHTLTTAVPVSQCATCHNGGSRAAMNFRGLMEAPPEGRQTFTWDQDLLHGHAYTRQPADVHYERGMACIDCHTEKELHGDGFVYAKRHYYVEIRCESCHGTPERLATGLSAKGRRLRRVFVGAPPNPSGTVTLLGKLTGRVHRIPQLAGLSRQPDGHDPTHLGRLECYACHTAWAPTCYGCHIRMDYTAYARPVELAFDHLSGEHSRQGWFRLTPGVRLADPEPVLGINWRGKVAPFVPRAQPLFTYVGSAGRVEYEFRAFGFAHNPIVPHTVTRAARSCASCHANPRALGLGAFTSREHPKLQEFGQPADFRWDRIVDEEGVPVQVTTVEGARPFSRDEMKRIRWAPWKLPARLRE